MKKLLSILLVGLMVASVFVVPASAFVPVREVTYTGAATLINQSYDGTSTDFITGLPSTMGFANSDAKGSSVVGPNVCLTSTTVLPTGAISYTLEFDVMLNLDYTATTGAFNGIFISSRGANYGFTFPLYGMKAGVPRSFKITVDESKTVWNEYTTMQFKDQDDSEWTSVICSGTYTSSDAKWQYRAWTPAAGGDNVDTHNHAAAWYSADHDFTLGARIFNGDPGFGGETIRVTFDNIKLTKDAGAIVGSNYAVTNGLIYTEDFDGAVTLASADANGKVTKAGEDSGNGYAVLAYADSLKPGSTTGGTATSVYADITTGLIVPNSTITFDAKWIDGTSPLVFYATNSDNTKKFALGIVGKDANWYTYKIELGDFSNKTFTDDASLLKVYKKARGAADSTYQELTNSWNLADNQYSPGNKDLYDYCYYKDATHTGGNKTGFGYYGFRVNDFAVGEHATTWGIDNLQVRNNVAYSGSYDKDSAVLFIDTPEVNETVIMASYDNSGALVDVDFANLDGATNEADLAVTAGNAATQIFVWNSLTGGKPILANPITIQ